MNDMKVHCKYNELVKISDLKPNPDNPNKHSEKKIERLALIINYQGWRSPIVVSNRSGLITKGHARLEAAILNNYENVPVDYQDYENGDQEFADMVADNAIADWSRQDLSMINEHIGSLGPDFQIDFLGLDGFEIEPMDSMDFTNKEIDTSNFGNDLEHKCPKCNFYFND